MIFFLSVLYFFTTSIIFIRIGRNNIKLVFLLSSFITYLVAISGLYINLPFGGADARTFEQLAWLWASNGLDTIAATFDVSRSYVISSITALFYYIFGREPFIPIVINAVLGLLIIYYSIKLFDAVWGENHRNKLLFIILIAFSPMLTINSAVILRENYITLFMLLASISTAKYINRMNLYNLTMVIVWLLFASFFHGAMILFFTGIPLYILISSRNVNIVYKAFIIIILAMVSAFLLDYFQFGKLKEIQESGFSPEYMTERLSTIREANTAYLNRLVPTTTTDILWQSPIRMFFFLLKPFPWDIRSIGHLIVWFDALLWLYIVCAIFIYRKEIKKNPAAMALLLCCLVSIFVFSYGTSNYGTAVRHRTKFLVEMLVIAVPFLRGYKLKPY